MEKLKIDTHRMRKQLNQALEYNKQNPVEHTYFCDKCKDTERIVHNQFELNEYTEPCECYFKKQTMFELSKAGLSKNKMDMSIEDFIVEDDDAEVQSKREEMKRKAAEYIRDEKGWLFISGNTGAGKTMICTIVSKHLAWKGKRLKYVNWKQEMNEARKEFGKIDSYDWNKIKNADLLYIDDFIKNDRAKRYGDNDEYYHVLRDVERFEYDYAFELLDYRSDKGLMTIISTEYKLDDIEAWNGALAGRIFEMVRKGGKIIEIPNEDKYNYRKFGKF